jgi:cytochrome P450
MTASPQTPARRRRTGPSARAARSSRARSQTGRLTSPISSQSWFADPYPIQADLRQRCPIARTERFGGGWLPTRYEDVAAIAYDTERFSSRSIIMSNFRPPSELAPAGGSPPISSDPPFHHDARKLLLPAFTKTAVSGQEPATRAFCHSLIDGFEGRDVADAARDYAQHIPMRVIADMLGFPPQDGPRFREFVENTLEGINLPPEERMTRMEALFDYLDAQIRDHLDNRREDLTTYLINAELHGRKLDPSHVAARWPCCSSPASTRRGARSVPRCGTWPRPRRIAGGSSPSPGCWRPRWRSSSGLRAGHHGAAGAAGHALARRRHEGR